MEKIVVLSGGTGSSKLIRGMQRLSRFTVVANVADNAWFHGLYVCPDIDTVTYTLAGIANRKHGWGIEGDTFRVLRQLKRLGAKDTWFRLGDLDLATSMLRTSLLKEGASLTEVTKRIGEMLGIPSWPVLPATDAHVETRIVTEEKGDLHLQEFWVREKGRPSVKSVRYKGIGRARETAEVAASISEADRIVIPPANPVTSILPILSVGRIRRALEESSARKVAVSPMIGKGPVSGPAAKFMASRGIPPTSEGVAELYEGLVDVLIVDEKDEAKAREIEKSGVSCLVRSTLMRGASDAERLAREVLKA